MFGGVNVTVRSAFTGPDLDMSLAFYRSMVLCGQIDKVTLHLRYGDKPVEQKQTPPHSRGEEGVGLQHETVLVCGELLARHVGVGEADQQVGERVVRPRVEHLRESLPSVATLTDMM